MNWEAIGEFLAENWVTITGNIGVILGVIFTKKGTDKEILASKKKRLKKLHNKNAKLENKLKVGLKNEANLEKELEEK